MSVTPESIEIENVVASSDIDQEFDLDTLYEDFQGADYNPDNFPGLVYRMGEPKASALIFRSGKVVCTGANSVVNVRTALETVFEVLRELGIEVAASPAIHIQNIVSSGDLDQPLNLNAIAIGLGLEDVEYEPEQFPGLVYRFDDPDVVVLLFGSGKCVVTGGKELDDAEEALTKIEAKLTDLGLLD
jgi:transcription initiation factor TFIID TATA-box-binding protein